MKGACILYPCYFNASLKRQQGRKVPLSRAIKTPTLVDLETSLKKSGVKYIAEQKHHPGHWAKREGRLVVTWDKSKIELLKQVSGKLEVRK
jgi:signal recognition particle subunit SRP19